MPNKQNWHIYSFSKIIPFQVTYLQSGFFSHILTFGNRVIFTDQDNNIEDFLSLIID